MHPKCHCCHFLGKLSELADHIADHHDFSITSCTQPRLNSDLNKSVPV